MNLDVNTLASLRHRNKGISHKTVKRFSDHSVYAVGTARTPALQQLADGVTYSFSDQMWDKVTVGFAKRSAAGEIFNNPMLHVHHLFRSDPVTFTHNLNIVRKDSSDNWTTVGHWYMHETNTVLSEHEVDSMRTLHAPTDRLCNLAITAAYAGVAATDQNALLWLGEFRETVSMFKDIGTGLLDLYRKTKKQREAWAKGKLNITEAQNLTLALLYGLLPLEQSISQVMAGLFKLKEDKTRHTSRGFQLYTGSNLIAEESTENNGGITLVTLDATESLQVEVRAGVLFDIDLTDIPTFLVVANPKALTETIYALARMSFVIDWFINVGNTIAAWSPSTGTNILSAWVSIEETYHIEGSKGTYHRAGMLFNAGRDKLESGAQHALPFYSKTVTKTRIPINRSDLAILPRVNINLDIDKILAMVLLFAKIKQP